MADFYVGADGGSGQYIEPVCKAIEKAGATAQRGSEGPNQEAVRNNGKIKPPTKLVYLVNGGLAGATYGSFALDYQDGMSFTIFAFLSFAYPDNSTLKEDALKTKKLVAEWDSGGFVTDAIRKDFDGHTCCSYQQKHSNIFAFISDEKSAESLGQRIAKGQYTCGKGSSSAKNEEEEEEWDDSDNFTPHKGKIMEIKPYKQIASVSYDKSYDSPTGTGNIDILYSTKDYRTMYKGVGMKLKLRRTCDEEWSPTGLEEAKYGENEKFFKEHIPTPELLKELGFPDYRKMQKHPINSGSSDEGTGEGEASGDSSSSSDSGSSSGHNPKAWTAVSRVVNKYFKKQANHNTLITDFRACGPNWTCLVNQFNHHKKWATTGNVNQVVRELMAANKTPR